MSGQLATPIAVIEVMTYDQLVEMDNGEYVCTIGARPDIARDTQGTPSQPGDVLSVQPDGTLQTRPAGATGSYERCKKTSAGLVYRPVGADGRSFLIPCATDAPN